MSYARPRLSPGGLVGPELWLPGGGGEEEEERRHVVPTCARSHIPAFISPKKPSKRSGCHQHLSAGDGETGDQGAAFYSVPPGLTRGQKLRHGALMATSSTRLLFQHFHSRCVSLSSCQSSAGGLLFPRSLTITF